MDEKKQLERKNDIHMIKNERERRNNNKLKEKEGWKNIKIRKTALEKSNEREPMINNEREIYEPKRINKTNNEIIN